MSKNRIILSLMYLCLSTLLVSCSQLESPKGTNEPGLKLVTKYHNDGNLKMIGYTIDNKKEGKWKFFRRQRLFSIKNYEKGVLHGKTISYEFCTEKVLEEGQYDMGQPVGLWYFYDDGEIVAIREYDNGKPTIVYHNPKFKNASEIPPSPPEDYDCY